MRNFLGIIAAILIGLVTGYFGVLVSVFSDGSVSERVITIGILLFIYFIMGLLFGFLAQKVWKFSFAFSLGGVYFLTSYMIKEFNIYYLIYVVFIIALPLLGSYLGNKFYKSVNN
ncbi:MAG: hypothetical protein GYA50_00670, partial [Eubacteriaceae bacterium]|nr:hypothetical protein [Eubacteriaceae bacterium]